jgi:micrococcal nuclease
MRMIADILRIVVVLLAATVLWSAPPVTEPPGSVSGPIGVVMGPTAAQFVKIADGDTIHLQIEGKEYTCRLLGIDAPESVDPHRPPGRFGKEAAAYLLARAKDASALSVEFAGPEMTFDKYKRLLVYLHAEPGHIDINKDMIAMGYAANYPRFKHPRQADYLLAEHDARGKMIGIWSPDPAWLVQITRWGATYHRIGCKIVNINKPYYNVTLGEASRWNRPCPICKPPTLPKPLVNRR